MENNKLGLRSNQSEKKRKRVYYTRSRLVLRALGINISNSLHRQEWVRK